MVTIRIRSHVNGVLGSLMVHLFDVLRIPMGYLDPVYTVQDPNGHDIKVWGHVYSYHFFCDELLVNYVILS